jgi:hypothetical protein
MTAPVYRFLPWVRRGLASGLTNPDTLGTLPSRPPLPVTLDVGDRTAHANVVGYGPGDVTGIDRRVILRTDPPPGTTDFEPNYLVAIEFDPPDFPWMFTPAAPHENRLRPWCVLVVIEKGPGVTLSVRPDTPLPILAITDPAMPSRELPDLRESWAWAHAQILEEAGTLDVDLDDGDRNLSRLLCPRRLKPETQYLACLVPAFADGVSRGLGNPPTGSTTTGPAWDIDNISDISLPLYHFWEFATAVEDDIETMARRLHGPENAPAGLGVRRVFAAAGHPDLASPSLPNEARAITMFGALRPASTIATPDVAQPAPLTDRVATIVARRDGPTLPPPLYGEWPARQHDLPTAGWQRQLNTEIGHRIAAALGGQVVREHQEDFVQAAWEQVGQLREANELATRARLSAGVLTRVYARHVASRPADQLIPLSGPMLAGTPLTDAEASRPSVSATIDATSMPLGVTSAAYRRLASGQRQPLKRATRSGRLSRRRGLIRIAQETKERFVEPTPPRPDGITALRDRDRLKTEGDLVSLAPIGLPGRTAAAEIAKLTPLKGPIEPVPSTAAFFPPSELAPVISQLTGRPAILRRGGQPISRRPRPVTDRILTKSFLAQVRASARRINSTGPVPAFIEMDVPAIRSLILDRLRPGGSVRRRVGAMVSGDAATGFDPYQGIDAFPILPEATARYLEAGDWLLPHANALESDTAVLLRTNTEFTSAFLVGLNHEMNQELLWRAYPTGQEGTPFQHFWDRLDKRPDITPIHTWGAATPLATAGLPSGVTDEQIVLLIRGTLLRRYPNMVIYATTGTRRAPSQSAPSQGRPQFFAFIRPDVYLVGFPLTEAQLASRDWWFILEQQLTAPRFGLDSLGPDSPTTWTDANWSWSQVQPGGHIDLDTLPPIPLLQSPVHLADPGDTPDKVADKLLQHPIRIAMHRDRLLLHPRDSA